MTWTSPVHRTLPLAILPLLAACRSGAPETSEAADRFQVVAEVNEGRDADHLPTPFRVEQIRRACPSGATRTYRLTGGPRSVTQVFRFLDSDGYGAAVQVESFDESGVLVSNQSVPKRPWSELQAHASYPTATTVRRRGEVEVLAGRFDCWIYTTRSEDGGVSETSFALAIPGPPVLALEISSGGEELERTELVSYAPRGPLEGEQ